MGEEELVQRLAHNVINAKYVIALTGAGLSTESGIPDYRGPQGIWTKNPEAEKKAYRSFALFQEDPRAYWEERLSVFSLLGDLASYEPNAGHYALVELEKMGLLRCVITQNIDGLHLKAGSENVLEYHGNAFKLRCISCRTRFEPEKYNVEKLQREGALPPLCLRCQEPIKSDIVHFGEPIPEDVIIQSIEEARRCDVMIICGTSASVYPFASLPMEARGREGVILVEVNASPTPLTEDKISDFLIEGRTGDILPRLVEAVKALKQGDNSL